MPHRRLYTPIIPSDSIAKIVRDPNFVPRIWAGKGGRQDWWTTTTAAIAAAGGIARTSQIIGTIRQGKGTPETVFSRLAAEGIVTYTDARWTGWRIERWVALDDRHPCMPELRDLLSVIARRLGPVPQPQSEILDVPKPPYSDAVTVDMERFFTNGARTRLLSLLAHVAPVTIYDVSGYGAQAVRQGHRTLYSLATCGLVSLHHSADEHHRVWVTLNRDADYSGALGRLVSKVASFQRIPFAALKKINDAKIERLIRERSHSTALLDRLKTREAILDT